MSRNNKNRRRGSRKSGEFKTCEEGASFVLTETVRQAKKKGDEEEGGRAKNTASARQLRGEIRELKVKEANQDAMIKMLQAALIGSMSDRMYEQYDAIVAADMKKQGIKKIVDYPLVDKDECLTKAKHEAITKVADDMIYMTHPGEEEHFAPSKLAVDTFGDIILFDGYEFKDLAREEKELLWDGKDTMFHYRLYCECRELDWKQAIQEGRGFHDYRKFVKNNSRDYFTEYHILTGGPVREGREDYEIPEFP